MIWEFAPVLVPVFERAFHVVTDIEIGGGRVVQVLIRSQCPDSTVCFQILHAHAFPLDELLEQSLERIFTGVHKPEIVEAVIW